MLIHVYGDTYVSGATYAPNQLPTAAFFVMNNEVWPTEKYTGLDPVTAYWKINKVDGPVTSYGLNGEWYNVIAPGKHGLQNYAFNGHGLVKLCDLDESMYYRTGKKIYAAALYRGKGEEYVLPLYHVRNATPRKL